jgi:hypothetical protein
MAVDAMQSIGTHPKGSGFRILLRSSTYDKKTPNEKMRRQVGFAGTVNDQTLTSKQFVESPH